MLDALAAAAENATMHTEDTMNTTSTRSAFLRPEEIEAMGAESYLRYIDAALEEACADDSPGIPHEQVMAEAWADVEKLVKKSA